MHHFTQTIKTSPCSENLRRASLASMCVIFLSILSLCIITAPLSLNAAPITTYANLPETYHFHDSFTAETLYDASTPTTISHHATITGQRTSSHTPTASQHYPHLQSTSKTLPPPRKITATPRRLITYAESHQGLWPSRDPIEENGGDNLYVFVGNDGINDWDILGKESSREKAKRCGKFKKKAEEVRTKVSLDLKACTITIFGGHSHSLRFWETQAGTRTLAVQTNVDNSKIHIPKNYPSAIGCVSCYGDEINDNLDNSESASYSCGIEGLVDAIKPHLEPHRKKPDKKGNFLYCNKVKKALEASLVVAKKQAEKFCKDKENCCPEITIQYIFNDQRFSKCAGKFGRTYNIKCKK